MATHMDESLISIPRQCRVKCDKTLPTCQRYISTECNRSSIEAEPPLNSPDSENPQRIEPDWAKGSAANNQRGRIVVELRACQAGVEKGQTKDFIWVEEPEGKNTVLGKRKANTASLPESRVKAISKRSRSNDDEQKVGDLIIVSSKDYIQAGREDEYPNSVPNSPQISNDAVRKARMALLAVDESSAPIDSKIELDCASPYSPSYNDEDDSPLCLSQERSNLSAPTSAEQDRPSSVPLSVPLDTTHTLGKLRNDLRAVRSSSSARNSQPGSLHNISPPPDGTHYLESSNNDKVRAISKSSNPRQFQSITQNNNLPDVPCKSLHAPNQTPTQATDDLTGLLKAYSSSNMSMLANVVIWRHAHDFYNWFKGETCTPKISILVFELYNAKGKLGKAFSVAILITPAPHQALPYTAGRNAMVPMPSTLLEGHSTATSRPNHGAPSSRNHCQALKERSGKRPDIITTDFFAWFVSETGRGGDEGPPSLRFTFKDAMPTLTSCTITKANEDHFNLIKRGLKAEYKSVREHIPSLKEFCVLVTDPGWVLEEDW
ncbi:hypothetical protein B0J14DRAFT_644455 [Halenospora varia]|nr:hypothetical protein B0J14DRAFT_644455 [Halenospora varia]